MLVFSEKNAFVLNGEFLGRYLNLDVFDNKLSGKFRYGIFLNVYK